MKNNYKLYINKKRKKLLLFLILSLIFTSILGYMVGFNLVNIIKGIPSMFNLVERMLRPDITYIEEVFSKLLETIKIAVTSSILGVILAIPFSLLIAKNIAPFKKLGIILNMFFSVIRTIPSLIWAALLVSIFSIGQFSGMVALSIIAFLMALKLFKENIETIKENLVNSIKSVGANQIQVLRYCIIPAIMEMIVSVFFIVLETNIRSATILGLVGAGGIGQIMWRDLNHLRYDKLSTLIFILFLTIASIDILSLLIRKSMKRPKVRYSSLDSYKKLHKFKLIFYIIGIIVLIALALNTIDISFDRLKLGATQGSIIIKGMARIDFSYLPKMFEGLKESLAIALFATIVGSFGALILSYLTAYNTSPSKVISIASKVLINILRTFPAIITAIIFFRGVGPGPLAGCLALSIYTTGVLTKLYSEVIEDTDENIKNSILSTGASELDSFRHGIFPQTLPNFISLALYRLESNVRNSTILGVIGAGGIGTTLSMNIAWRNWERVGLLILGIALMIILIDTLSSYSRKKFS